MAGKCERCDHLFQLPQDLFKTSSSVENSLIDFSKESPARPKTLTAEQGPSRELYLRKSWITRGLLMMLMFCVIWDAFLVFWYFIAFTQKDTPLMMFLFPIIHVVVGVCITYYVIAGFLNKTHLFTDSHSILVKHKPIPWIGNKEIDASGITSLSVYTDRGSQWSNKRHYSTPDKFRIVANRNGEQVGIISGLDRSEVRYVAYRLANQLKCDLNCAI